MRGAEIHERLVEMGTSLLSMAEGVEWTDEDDLWGEILGTFGRCAAAFDMGREADDVEEFDELFAEADRCVHRMVYQLHLALSTDLADRCEVERCLAMAETLAHRIAEARAPGRRRGAEDAVS